MQASYFYVHRDASGAWRWSLKRNGLAIASSPVSYDDLEACERGVVLMRQDCLAAVVIGDDTYTAKRDRTVQLGLKHATLAARG